MSKTVANKKDEFKKFILDLEQEIIMSSDQIDSQQIVNKIVKHYDEVAEKEAKDENK